MNAEAASPFDQSRLRVGLVPVQTRRPMCVPPAERLVRQVEAVDAWIAARRDWEQSLPDRGLSRDERMDVARQVEALRRTHDMIKGRCARGLDAPLGPLREPARTAVIAHRHNWFVDKLALLLGSHGVTVLVATDNGAEALGAVVAEQPDVLLVGDRLAMTNSSTLLAESRLYSPCTLLTAQTAGPAPATGHGDADMVFLHHHPPRFIADDLLTLLTAAAAARSRS